MHCIKLPKVMVHFAVRSQNSTMGMYDLCRLVLILNLFNPRFLSEVKSPFQCNKETIGKTDD